MSSRLLCLTVGFVVLGHAALFADGRQDARKETTTVHYVEPSEQLVVEIYVRNVRESIAFYEKLGFQTVRKEPTFAELAWEGSRLFVEQIPGQPSPPTTLVANIRIMVPDVDRFWKLCQDLRLPVVKKIGDRSYGLRDFTVTSPDGIGLRFASHLK